MRQMLSTPQAESEDSVRQVNKVCIMEIKNIKGEVIYTCDCDGIKTAVIKAVKEKKTSVAHTSVSHTSVAQTSVAQKKFLSFLMHVLLKARSPHGRELEMP